MDSLQFHEMKIYWLDGGNTAPDGGAMFGVVPKPLWTKKYPCNENNQVELATDPILIQYKGKNIMVDSGIGNGKLSEKQKRNLGVWSEPKLAESLAELGLTASDIDTILMTHLHYDHVGGLTIPNSEGNIVSRFPNAKIIVNQIEWDENLKPTVRSKSAYWKENWEAVQEQIVTYTNRYEAIEGMTLIHTGGHSTGHAVLKLEQNGELIVHMADIMPTHAHQNPLWVLAYDDYPMDTIFAKEKILPEAYEKNAKFIFYHDAYYRMMQWSDDGKDIVDHLLRTKKPFIPHPNLPTK